MLESVNIGLKNLRKLAKKLKVIIRIAIIIT